MGGAFRVTVWDPTLIMSQIIALQSSFYFGFGLLLGMSSIFTPSELSLDTIFYDKPLAFSDRNNVLTITCYMLNALAGSVGLWLIVKRTKQCLDFTVTAYVIHAVICWCYNGTFPSSLSWWVLTTLGVAIMCITGEFLCLKTELEDIPLLGERVDL